MPNDTNHGFDTIILGAGIVGCACARECALAGLRVLVVEPRAVGAGATGAAMGHVVLMDDSPAQLALTRYARSLWRELRPQLPVSVEYASPGTVWVAADGEELQQVVDRQRRYAAAGLAAEMLDARALAEAEPNLRTGLAGGLLVPDDAVIDPLSAARFFLEEAERAGAVLRQGHAAVAIGEGRCTLSDGAVLSAKHVVVATGTATALLPWLTLPKRKGHLLLTESYPGYLHHQLVELGYLKSAHAAMAESEIAASVAFNVQPRQTGQLLIGSSRQYGVEHAAIEDTIVTRMMDRACSYMPGLRALSTARAWTGFRAATADKLPLIGPTEDPSVFLAAGFEGLGITGAPAAARLLADHLLGREPEIDARPYLPARLRAV